MVIIHYYQIIINKECYRKKWYDSVQKNKSVIQLFRNKGWFIYVAKMKPFTEF